MLFSAVTLNGLVEGRVSCTYRRWVRVRPKVGSRFTTRVGVVEVTSIEPVDDTRLTSEDAAAAGFATVAALHRWTRAKGAGELYRIGLRIAGPDPRVALRASSVLDDAEGRTIEARLGRMDRAAEAAWTMRTLQQIERRPAVVSTELAAEAGEERQPYKIRVRRLKALGLTESLEVGYRLSPRGQAYLEWVRSSRPDDRHDPAQHDDSGDQHAAHGTDHSRQT